MALNASCSLSIPQRRKGVVYSGRAILDKRAKEHHGKQNGLIKWFHEEYKHQLDQSKFSRILVKLVYYLITKFPGKNCSCNLLGFSW